MNYGSGNVLQFMIMTQPHTVISTTNSYVMYTVQMGLKIKYTVADKKVNASNFGRYTWKNGVWWFEKYNTKNADGGVLKLLPRVAIALAPKNAVNFIDTTTLDYSNASHVDEKVNRHRIL